MIFQETHAQVLAGTKTQTRRLMKPAELTAQQRRSWARCVGHQPPSFPLTAPKLVWFRGGIWKPCRYQPGHAYSVQPGRGEKGQGTIRIASVEPQRLGALTAADAIAEGFTHPSEFFETWFRLHKDLPDFPQLDIAVWKITFALDDDEPRYMPARPRSGDEQLTTSAANAVPDESPCEVVPEHYQEQLALTASTRDAPKRLSSARSAPEDLQVMLDAQRRLEQRLEQELDERFVDWQPHEIAAHAPHQGDAADIRERRRKMGQRSIDGRPPLKPKQRADTETFLRRTRASVREIERALDISHRAAYELQISWADEDAIAA